jgi:predicted dehydrogenase
MARVGVALVGCGSIGSAVHLRALGRAPAARVVGIADPDAAARARAQRIAGRDAVASADPLELIAHPDTDAVVICAPNAVHAELALAACAAARAVYVEKPLALTTVVARAVVAATEASGRAAAVGFNHRFHPLHRRARELLRAGAIGRVRAVTTAFCEPMPVATMPAWKRSRATGGGALLDLGSHQIDLVRWLLDDEVEQASARLQSELSDDDSAELRLELGSGAVVDGWFSFRSGRCDWLQLVGDRGVLTLDRYAPQLRLATARCDIGAVRRGTWPAFAASRPWQLRKALRPAWEPSYARALRAFVAAAGGAPVELPAPRDGLRTLEVVLAAESTAIAEPLVEG